MIVLLFAVPLAFSQDSGGNADSGSGAEGSGGVTSFFNQDASSTGGSPAITWSGDLNFKTRATINYGDPTGSPVLTYPSLSVAIDYKNEASQVHAELIYDRTRPADTFEGLINEAYLELFYPAFRIQAGYLKVVWGTGDQIHVVDVLNPTDYTDFINPSYLDRKMAEKMLMLTLYAGTNGSVEFAYLPVFTPDRIPLEGQWVPQDVRKVEAAITTPSTLSGLVDAYLQEARTLDHAQFAARYSTSVSGVDLGATYYYGFLREPVVAGATTPSPALTFNRVHMAGIDGATVAGGFNLRWEAAYFLTGDTAGDDPLVYNNRVKYLGGFDRDLPLSNLNINVQDIGTWVLATDGLASGDVDFDPDGDYLQNTLVARISDNYAHGQIKPEIAVTYGIEKQDFMVRPKVEFSLKDEATLTLVTSIFSGDKDTQFGQFESNDFIEAQFSYAF